MIYRGYTIRTVGEGVIAFDESKPDKTERTVFSFVSEERAMDFIDRVRKNEREALSRESYQDGNELKKEMEQ